MMEPIIVIVGPTGVGKTKLSIELAHRLDAEIINGDSMQVYRGLEIGTAKVQEEEKEGIAHHLFDLCDVQDLYTVYDYQRDCRKAIEEITSRGKRIIIVGGTGLYIKAALYDYRFQEGTVNDSREDLTNEALLERILTYDPSCKIHVNNRKRLVRALNKYEYEDGFSKTGDHLLYPAIFIGLTTDRQTLYEKIDQRVDEMFKAGLVEEVRPFFEAGISSKALDTGIGYKELFPYFLGKIDEDTAKDLIKKNSRHYAKRQYTFFSHQLPVTWFETCYQDFLKTVTEVLIYLEKWQMDNG